MQHNGRKQGQSCGAHPSFISKRASVRANAARGRSMTISFVASHRTTSIRVARKHNGHLGKSGHASYLYSLGGNAYSLLTFTARFSGSFVRMIRKEESTYGSAGGTNLFRVSLVCSAMVAADVASHHRIFFVVREALRRNEHSFAPAYERAKRRACSRSNARYASPLGTIKADSVTYVTRTTPLCSQRSEDYLGARAAFSRARTIFADRYGKNDSRAKSAAASAIDAHRRTPHPLGATNRIPIRFEDGGNDVRYGLMP